MKVITQRHWLKTYQDQSKPTHNSNLKFLNIFGTKEWIVVLYCDDTHFSGHAVDCTCQSDGPDISLHGCISYLDSLLDKGTVLTTLLHVF